MVRFNVRNVLTMEIFRQKGSDMEEKHQTLKELPVSERPYEKCEKNGTAMLSDAELLAVILRSGTKDQTAIDLATKVLSIDPFYEGILGICHTSREELQKIPGIGKVKAMQILCIAELSKRLASAKVEDKISFHPLGRQNILAAWRWISRWMIMDHKYGNRFTSKCFE